MQQQSSEYQSKLEDKKFTIDTMSSNNITFFTRFTNKQIFEDILELLNPGPNGENLVYTRNEAKDEEN